MVDRAGTALEVDALVRDGVGDHDVVERLASSIGVAVEVLGDALAIGRLGRGDRVQASDAIPLDPSLHQDLPDPLVRRHRLAEDDVAAVGRAVHVLRNELEFRARVVRLREVPLDGDEILVIVVLGDLVQLRRAPGRLVVDAPSASDPAVEAVIGDLPTRDATVQRGVPAVALVELRVHRDERETGEKAEHVAHVLLRLDHVLHPGDHLAVLVLLIVVHDDDSFREAELGEEDLGERVPLVDDGNRRELAVAEDDLAELSQV